MVRAFILSRLVVISKTAACTRGTCIAVQKRHGQLSHRVRLRRRPLRSSTTSRGRSAGAPGFTLGACDATRHELLLHVYRRLPLGESVGGPCPSTIQPGATPPPPPGTDFETSLAAAGPARRRPPGRGKTPAKIFFTQRGAAPPSPRGTTGRATASRPWSARLRPRPVRARRGFLEFGPVRPKQEQT